MGIWFSGNAMFKLQRTIHPCCAIFEVDDTAAVLLEMRHDDDTGKLPKGANVVPSGGMTCFSRDCGFITAKKELNWSLWVLRPLQCTEHSLLTTA